MQDRPSKRTDRKIPQPQIGETAGFPDAIQGPVDAKPQRVVAALDGNPDAFAKIAAFDERPADEGAATAGTRAIKPERQRESVAEQQIHLAAPQRFAGRLGIAIAAQLRLG